MIFDYFYKLYLIAKMLIAIPSFEAWDVVENIMKLQSQNFFTTYCTYNRPSF